MGKKLDGVKRTSKEGREMAKKGGEMGNKTVTEIRKMKALRDSISPDLDDAVIARIQAMEQATTIEGVKHMNTEVKSTLDNSKKKMVESNKTSTEQINNNENVKGVFKNMDSIASFGKNARADGSRAIDSVNKEFNAEISENDATATSADITFNKQLSDISNTF